MKKGGVTRNMRCIEPCVLAPQSVCAVLRQLYCDSDHVEAYREYAVKQLQKVVGDVEGDDNGQQYSTAQGGRGVGESRGGRGERVLVVGVGGGPTHTELHNCLVDGSHG